MFIRSNLFFPQEAEGKGVSPEEVYTSLRVSGGISGPPCDWVKTELPHRLDEICAMAASFQHKPKPLQTTAVHHNESQKTCVPLSRAEAKQAWLTAGGDSEKAARQALRDRLARVSFRIRCTCIQAVFTIKSFKNMGVKSVLNVM